MEPFYLLLALSTAMLMGLILSRFAKLVSLPAVTAYLVAGIIVGPFCLGAFGVNGLGFTSLDEIKVFEILTTAALGFIAFSIGNEFRVSQLKKIGKTATFIGIFQAVIATLVVDAALIGMHFMFPDVISIPTALVLGAIAAATAPAATLMVVRQYKAKGPLTDLLLPIVAIDDAVGLVVFAISCGIARAIEHGHIDVISIVVNPIIEIIASLLLGTVMGVLLNLFERFFHSRSKRMSISIAFVFLTVAVAMCKFSIGPVTIQFSSLLTCMMLGTVFCNLCAYSEELMERVDGWTAPLFIIFFVLSGAELNIAVLKSGTVILVGVTFLIFRAVGKYFGSYGSAKWCGCDSNVCKYLGITLLPQAGVALGMSTQVGDLGGAELIRNIVLFSVLILELVGPLASKIALTKAGDIIPENATTSRGIVPSKHTGPHPKQKK